MEKAWMSLVVAAARLIGKICEEQHSPHHARCVRPEFERHRELMTHPRSAMPKRRDRETMN